MKIGKQIRVFLCFFIRWALCCWRLQDQMVHSKIRPCLYQVLLCLTMFSPLVPLPTEPPSSIQKFQQVPNRKGAFYLIFQDFSLAFRFFLWGNLLPLKCRVLPWLDVSSYDYFLKLFFCFYEVSQRKYRSVTECRRISKNVGLLRSRVISWETNFSRFLRIFNQFLQNSWNNFQDFPINF